ncbi:MAG: N-acetyltransferase family protein [Mariniblastus sp.]
MSINIRPATLEDATTIANFQIAMAMETENKTLESNVVATAVQAVFEDQSGAKGFYLVGESEGTVVGSLMVTFEWSDWRNSNMWYIQSVFVEKDSRGKGVFKKLYQKVLEMAKEKNVMFVRLYVETENEKAQKAYESLGMKRMPYYMYDVRV